MVELLGFQITRAKEDGELKKDGASKQAFTIPTPDDGTTTISAGGYFGQYLDMEVNAKNDSDLIRRYREVAQNPECDMAIEDIVNEVIVSDERDSPVTLSLDKLDISENIKQKIRNEFDEVLSLSITCSTALSIPRLISIGFIPAVTYFNPSLTIA